MFCWSAHRPERSELPSQPGTVGATQIIYGTEAAAAWRHSVIAAGNGSLLTDEQITRVGGALDKQVRSREANLAETTPAPPTLNRIYWTGLGILLAFSVGLLGNLNTLTTTKSWTTWTGVTIAQAAVGLAALRTTRARRFAVAWLIAVTCASVLAAIGVIVSIT